MNFNLSSEIAFKFDKRNKQAKQPYSHLIDLPLFFINYYFLQVKNGTVKFFNESKGFGFIVEEGSNSEHFVHVSGLIDEIKEGDKVEFELKEGRKGLNAVSVRVI